MSDYNPLNPKVRFITIDASHAGQRIDNYLFRVLKGVPKTRVYRAIREGEVRVNKGRIKQDYRLKEEDQVRIPPLRMSEETKLDHPPTWQLEKLKQDIIYEDEELIIINKTAGMAVHGGSGVNFGVIETLRYLRPQTKFLELVHRLDRDTSGCLMIAKKRAALVELHHLLQTQGVEKVYLTLVKGRWQGGRQEIKLALQKNQLSSGERIVKVSDSGKPAVSIFEPVQFFPHATLMKVTLMTGRTHQIRVHAAHVHHPIAGDEKYGDKKFNQLMRTLGLKRLFLHAASLTFYLSDLKKMIAICSCLDKDLLNCLHVLASKTD